METTILEELLPGKTLQLSPVFIEEKTSLTPQSTIGELPNYDACITPNTPVQFVSEFLEKQMGLPGVIIVENGHCLALLSRSVILESLSRPFGTELYLRRPIRYMLQNVHNKSYILSSEKRIDEAVQIALSRPIKDLYEPFVVQFADHSYRLLDFYVLLLAQTQLLANANDHIKRQVQTGRALSHLLDIQEVTAHILNDLAIVVPYDRAAISIMRDGKMMSCYQALDEIQVDGEVHRDIIQNEATHQYLCDLRKPVIIQGSPQFDERPVGDFPETIQSWIGFPMLYSNEVIGIISLTRVKRLIKTGMEQTLDNLANPIVEYTHNDIDLLTSLEPAYAVAIRNAQLHGELENLAVTDPLTSINNRRGFFQLASREVAHYKIATTNLSILMIDIDFFKRVNDYYGHAVGDEVIQRIAKACRDCLRENDLIGRYGGEEFVILLHDSDLATARIVAERVRHNIAQLRINTEKGPISVTISIGVANIQDSSSLDTLLQHADEALYQAKKRGRNRVEVWVPNELLNLSAFSQTVKQINSRQTLVEDSMLDNSQNPAGNPMVDDKVFEETILGWARLLELKDKETEGHAQRVAEITTELAQRIGIEGNQLVDIYRGALLHDIGKIGVPDHILFKPGRLTEDEWVVMRKHPDYAYQILSPIALLNPILPIPFCHHEKWDGSGYPRGIKGKEIPIEARLFAMVDVWDALNSNRVYRPAWSPDQIYQYLLGQAGIHFDPELVPVFLEFISQNVSGEGLRVRFP